mgnify:CR=1 FL=1
MEFYKLNRFDRWLLYQCRSLLFDPEGSSIWCVAFCDVICPMFERWHGRIVAYQIINHMNLKEVMGEGCEDFDLWHYFQEKLPKYS